MLDGNPPRLAKFGRPPLAASFEHTSLANISVRWRHVPPDDLGFAADQHRQLVSSYTPSTRRNKIAPHFAAKWRPEKARKKLLAVQSQLFQGEDVWFLGECNNLRPMLSEIAITPLRVVGLIGTELKFEAAYGQITQFTADTAKNAVEVVCSDGRSVVFKNVPAEDMGAIRHYYEHGRSHPAPEHLVRTANETVRARSAASARAADAAKLHWPQSAIRGPLTKKPAKRS